MPITLATQAMGTRFELVLSDDDPHRLRAVGEMALREITECSQRFNLFDPGSWLSTINRRAVDEPVVLDDLTFNLLEVCRQVHDDSDGAFDVTVAPLMYAWGFHTANGSADRAAIEKARLSVGMRYVELNHQAKTVRFTQPGVAIDFGAVAKGFAIDLAMELLHEHGITCALLHGGTSTAATIGSPPGEDGWRIKVRCGVDAPTSDPDIAIVLKDSALSVSAPHGRVIESDGETLGHVLDPRSGSPATCGKFAAAVGPSACLADAWSTALLVLGHRPDRMPASMQAILPEPQTPGRSPAAILTQPVMMEGLPT